MSLKINHIKPTIFFIRKKNRVLQAVDVSILNSSEMARARLEVKIGQEKCINFNLRIGEGEKIYRIYVPDIRKTLNVEFSLYNNQKLEDKKSLGWETGNHWTVYLNHLSHHDLGYTDLPSNVLREYEGFFEEILNFCKKTDNFPFEAKFRYVVEQSWSILNFMKNGPKKIIDEIIKYIKEGRIEITALFGNQITNLCSHEELIRLLYPSFQLKRKYKIPINSGYQNDITGLSWGLPLILSGAGVKYLSAFLPAWYFRGEKVHSYWDEEKVLSLDIPGLCRWEGPDGGQIFLWSDSTTGMSHLWSYEQSLSEIEKKLNLLENKDYPFDVVKYEILGGFRDNSPPLLRLSYIVKEWNKKWTYPRLILGTNALFFEDLEKRYRNELDKLPVFRGEIPCTDYVVGATSTAKETGINRVTHDRLNCAEKFAAIASKISDYSYPAETIEEAYQNMLLYDEHTWGMCFPAGPAQDANLSERRNLAYRASALSQNILSKSLNKIADEIKLSEEGTHVVVFNSLSWEREGIVQVPFKELAPHENPMHDEDKRLVSGAVIGRSIINLPSDFIEGNFNLIDLETKEELQHQILKIDNPHLPLPCAEHRYALGSVDRSYLFDLVFHAKNIPPMGYKTYRLVPSNKKANFKDDIFLNGNIMENQFYKITLSVDKGTIENIYDKELNREIVDSSAPHSFNQIIIRYARDGKEEFPNEIDIKKGKDGPLCKSLIISSRASGCPLIVQEVILYDRIKRIDLNTKILKDSTPFQEIYSAFPFSIENPEFKFEGTDSIIEPLKDQLPGSNSNYYAVQHRASVSNKEVEIVLSSIESHLIEFGGLWQSYVSYAHHAITPPGFGRGFKRSEGFTKGYMYSYIMANNFRTNFSPVQTGEALFRYSITSHRKNDGQNARNFGWETANSLIPVCINGKKEGKLKEFSSFCQIDKQNVLMLTFKKAENGQGTIFRLLETEGKNAVVGITFPYFDISHAYQTNIVEENKKIIPSNKHSTKVEIKPFEIMTIRLTF